MSRILLIYSTTDGHTLKICQRIQELLVQQSQRVDLREVDHAGAIAWGSYQKIIIGARIRFGKHHPQVYQFIEKSLAQLQAKPSAFFSVNVVARKPGKNTVETNPYMQAFLRLTPWRPTQMAVFAGRIEYRKYRWWERQMIRLIMWLTHGPTNLDAAVEFTDWAAVEEFSTRIARM